MKMFIFTELGASYTLPKNESHIRSKIIGGARATIAEAPHQVTLLSYISFPDSKEYISRCGGALITFEHVLTAAHCIYSKYKLRFKVIAGTDNISTEPENIRYSKREFIHPQFSMESKLNDIAIILVSMKINLKMLFIRFKIKI